MSKASSIYILFALVFAAGLWLILGFGASLIPPPNLAGQWELSTSPHTLTIEQSGKFLRLAPANAPPIQLTLLDQLPSHNPLATIFRFENPTHRLIAEGTPNSETFHLTLTGPDGFDTDARRTVRASGGPATRPTTTQVQSQVVAKPLAHSLQTLLIQIAVVLAVSRLVGFAFTRIHQPQVMGEMIAGIMLGPSLLGWLFPGLSLTIFPSESIPALGLLAQLGVILFLFLIGLELDPKLIKNRGHAAVVISHASIIAPFLLGSALVLFLYTQLFNDTREMRFTAVSLFMGAAMSITAFPVLARILTESNLHKTKVGAITITCAAVDDVSAWCLLAFVVAIARASGLQPALITALLSVGYVLVMFFMVRPFLHRLQLIYDRQSRLSPNVIAIIFLCILASACTTEAIGIHALFGAFLMGAIMPKGTRFVRHLSEKLEDYTVVFLLPIFFAYTGLKTRIGLLDTQELWLYTLLIIAVACAGKFGGSLIAARACGIPLRESAAIGILMNTRGLMELVILNIGRELGVITDAVFAMMVLMAIVTTAMTTPILNWVYPRRLFAAEAGAVPERPSVAEAAAAAFNILIPVSLPRSAKALVQIANMISGPTTPSRKIIALFLRRPDERDAYRAGIEESPQLPDPLAPVVDEAARLNLPVEPVSFVSREISSDSDISQVAQSRSANLILMGFHKPVIGSSLLGGTVHRVLSAAPTDTAILIDRGLPDTTTPLRILVPYLGGTHDRFALELANRISRNTSSPITVLHVVPPTRANDAATLHAKTAVDRVFNEPGATTPITFRIIEDLDPIRAVLQQSASADLVLLGLAEEWGLESHLLGFRPQRIATECPVSLLLVRKHTTHGRE